MSKHFDPGPPIEQKVQEWLESTVLSHLRDGRKLYPTQYMLELTNHPDGAHTVRLNITFKPPQS